MLRYNIPAVSITGQHGRIWTTKPTHGQSGLVAVLQVPASKYSEAVRALDFTVVAMERRADLLVTADTRGHVYVFDIRQNRFSCLDKAGCAGTAALVHGPRSVFVAFADSSIRCYDASKGTIVGVLREHRSPVRHMEVNRELNELMSTSVDGVLVWDLKKLRRKRVLGSGPFGALQASYTPDGLAVVTHFKDGSFYVWSAGNFSLVRSFTLPVAPTLRPAQTAFCLSPDGQLLVSCGPNLPVLLVYSVIGGTLRYGVGLPAAPSPLDVSVEAAAGGEAAVAAAVAGAAAAAAAAAEAAASGGAVLPPPGEEPRALAAAALAAKLPMGVGVQQVVFLPDSATVAAMLTDGSVAFVDVLACTFVGNVPYIFPERPDGCFSMDARAQHMALTADGKVFLFDLAGKATSVQPPRQLPRLLPSQLDDLAAAVALEHMRRQSGGDERQRGAGAEEEGRQDRASGAAAEGAGAPVSDTQQLHDNRTTAVGPAVAAGAKPTAAAGLAAEGKLASATAGARGPPAASAARQQQVGAGRAELNTIEPTGAVPMATKAAAAAAGGGGGAKADLAAVSLNRTRLEALLEAFGEYPAKYRLMIWDFLLQLPHNTSAFRSLAGLGLHSAYKDLASKLPLANRALAQRLAATLSQLAHWCPVFAESSFLPDLVFPFVKLFASAPGLHGASGGGGPRSSAALDERCFETLATLLGCGWMRGWWERFPHPPLGLLTRVQDLIALHDAPLAAHFGVYRGGLAGVVWSHLATLWTELLTRSDWLRLWDHCVTAGPDLLYFFVAAYMISLRAQLMAMDTDHKLANWMAGPPPVDMGEVLRVAYLLRNRTPEELRPAPSDWQPLPQGPTYVEFKGFPAGAVELFAADRARIREAEDAIMRRRAVVSELELRTRAVALQAASLSTERQQLAALEEERRAMLRQLEADTATELARLDDRAKAEKLKQIAAVEKAYQDNLLEVRATWQRELEFARAELAHKRAMAAQQIRNRQEDEQIKSLEFHAQQRMREMEEDVRRGAVASAVRDELLVQQMEAEAKQRAKLKEWETEDEARKQRLQHEAERRAQLAQAAEQSAARNAAVLEAQATALQIEDEVVKVDGQRRLRRLAEDAALMTAEARAAEEARLAARAAAEQEAMRLRAKADVAWYEAEQMRREQMLEQERQQMEAAAAAARQKLSDTEAAARTMAAQAELLERRRLLERQNAAEEVQVRRLVSAMAAERGRDAVLVSDLEAKEDEMKAKLEHYVRLGSLQREVESAEAAAAVALMAKLDEQQRRELLELRRLHDAALERLSKELEGQAAEAAAQRRAELRNEQLEAVRAAQVGFERRKPELHRELLREQSRRLRQAAEAATDAESPRKERPAPAPAAQRTPAAPEPTQPPANRVAEAFAAAAAEASVSRPAPAARPAAAAAAEAARHADLILRVFGAGSNTSTAPTLTTTTETTPATVSASASDPMAAAAALRAMAASAAAAGLLTPRRRSFDFLSDSNLTPASYISSITTSSSAPSPEAAAAVAAIAAAMGPREAARPAAPLATAAAAAAARSQAQFSQTSAVGVWPPQPLSAGAAAARKQPAASIDPPRGAAAAAAVPSTSSSSLISGTASSDTVPNIRGLPPAASGAAAASSTSGGAAAGHSSTTDESSSASGNPGIAAAAAAATAALAAAANGASRGWPWRPMSPLREEELGPGHDDVVTPSASPSSFLPTITPSTAAGTAYSVLDSSARAPPGGRGPQEPYTGASIAAATAMQRASLAAARAMSPERRRSAEQQPPPPPPPHQPFGAERDLSPSSVSGGSSVTPTSGLDSDLRAILGLEDRGRSYGGRTDQARPALRTGATGGGGSGGEGTSGSSSALLDGSAGLGPSRGLALQHYSSTPQPATASAAAAAVAVAAPRPGSQAPSAAADEPAAGRPPHTSQSDSWTSLQRSGLLGLSHALGPPPPPMTQFPVANRYDAPSAASVAAHDGGGLDTYSSTTGLTSLTNLSTFTSPHVSFTPATRGPQQQSESQLLRHSHPQRPPSRQELQQPRDQQRERQQLQPSPSATPGSATTTVTSSSTSGSVPAAAAAAAAGTGLTAVASAASGGGDTSGSGTDFLFTSGGSSWPLGSSTRSGGWLEGIRELTSRPLPATTSASVPAAAAAGGSGTRGPHGSTGRASSDDSPADGGGGGLSSPSTRSLATSPSTGPSNGGTSVPTASDRSGVSAAESGALGRGVLASSSSVTATATDSGTGSGPGLRGGAGGGASSSSADFPSLRDSRSSSAVLLGGLAHGAAKSPSAAPDARVGGGAAEPYSSSSAFSSFPSEAAAATAATGSLRPALSTGAAAAALYGSIDSSSAGGGGGSGSGGGSYAALARGGTGSGSYAVTRAGTGTGTGTTSSSYERGTSYGGRTTSQTRSSITTGTAGTADTGDSSDAFLSGQAALAALLAGGAAGAGSWSPSRTSATATGASGAPSEDVADVLRLLRLSANAGASLPPMPPQLQQPAASRSPRPLLQPSYTALHTRALFMGSSAGIDELLSLPVGGGTHPSAIALGFGSRLGSSGTASTDITTSSGSGSRAGSEPGPTGRGAEWARDGGAAAAGKGVYDRAGAGEDADRPVGRSDDDDEDDDDVSIVAVATPHPGGRPSPSAPATGAAAGRDSLRSPLPGDGGGGGGGDGGRPGGDASSLYRSFDGGASDLFGSSPGASTAAPFTAGYDTTPGGASDLSAVLRRMERSWGDGAAVPASESTMTPTTVTGLTAYGEDDDSAMFTGATRATAGTARRTEIDDDDDDEEEDEEEE